jgi:polyhydroxybutyrate depolymerase
MLSRWALVLAAMATMFTGMLATAGPGAGAQGVVTQCPDAAHTPGDTDLTLVSGGLTREYRLHVPPSYTGEEPAPLVLLFHGAGASGPDFASHTGFAQKADEAGFIVAFPTGTQGEGPLASLGRIFNHLTFTPGFPDDVAFTGELLDELESQVCVDTTRVYAAGFSNGGMFSVRLACSLGERVAAVAAVAGVYYPPFATEFEGVEPDCGERPVPLLAIHGTEDGSVPFAGGQLGPTLPLHVRHVENEIMPEWAAHNGCDEAGSIAPVTEHARRVTYEGCTAATELYVIEGGIHVWPGADDLKPPDINDEIVANDVIWSFFESQVLAADPEPTATASAPTATSQPAALPSTGAGPEGRDVSWWVWGAFALAAVGAPVVVGAWRFWMRGRGQS